MKLQRTREKMITTGCIAACTAHTVSSRREETKKATQLQKANWQQNSENLKKQRDRTPKNKPQA